MRTMAWLLAFTTAGSMAAATPQDNKTALLNELIQLTHGTETALESLIISTMPKESERTPEQAAMAADELRSGGRIQTAVTRATFDILSERLTEPQLKQLVSFFKSDAGKAYCEALAVLAKERPARIVNAIAPPGAIERSLQKRTMGDIRVLATAAEAYATDNNKYPAAKTMEELRPLLSPTYIHTLPMADAWRTPFAYRISADKLRYRFVSAGPDKKFDPTSLDIGKTPSKSDDIVYENGQFLQAPIKQE